MSRPRTKTAILCLRVVPAVREVLQEAATAERRSLANMSEVLILEGCERRGLFAQACQTDEAAKAPKK